MLNLMLPGACLLDKAGSSAKNTPDRGLPTAASESSQPYQPPTSYLLLPTLKN